MYTSNKIPGIFILIAINPKLFLSSLLTLYDPGGALKAPHPPIFCSHVFNFGAALLCVGDFSQKIV